MAFAPDGGWLASSGNDALVRLWDPQSGQQVQALPHPAPVYAITWSPDGRLLASGDFQGAIRLWQMQQTQPATCLQTLFGHSNWVTGLAFAPNGALLASANWDGTVKLWEGGGGKPPPAPDPFWAYRPGESRQLESGWAHPGQLRL